MRQFRLLSRFCASGLIAATALMTLSVNAGDAPPEPQSGAWCEKNAEKCAQMQKAHDEYCAKNPQTCETRKDRREGRKEYCEQNPDKCKALKDERQARRERLKEQCAQNPEQCEQKKQEFRERADERRERRREAIDEAQESQQKP